MSVLALALAVQSVDTLSLAQALTRALADRPLAAVAEARVVRAQGSSRLARLIPNPTGQLDFYDGAPARKLLVTQGLGWVPRRFADVAVGRALVDRARSDSLRLIAEVGRQVRIAFFGTLAGRERHRFAVEQRRVADSLVVVAERRLAAGDISALERDQAVLEAGRAVQAALRAAEEADAARIRFAQAIGITGASVPEPAGSLDDDLGATIGEDGGDPPELAAAIADSMGAAARLRSARIGQLPPIALRGGSEWGGPGEASTGFVGFSLGLPLWSRGRENVAEARGAFAEAAAATAEARLAVFAQVGQARLRLQATATRALLARDSIAPAARRIRAGTLRLYQQGRTGIIPVLEAIRAERDVTLETVDALLAYQAARAELLALHGRWQ